MKEAIALSVCLLLTAKSAFASDYQDGVAMGQTKLRQEFQARENNCSRLVESVNASKRACVGYPNSDYANGCTDGVQAYYETIRWTVCRPSSDQCKKAGEDAADLIASRLCHAALTSPAKSDADRESCYRAALPSCEAVIRDRLNSLVFSHSCWIDNERTNARTQPYEIYDTDFTLVQKQCNTVVRQILGMSSGTDTTVTPDTYSGQFNIYENMSASNGDDLPGFPQTISKAACDNACAARGECYAWTFVESTGQCFLKDFRAVGKFVSVAGYATGVRKEDFSGQFILYDGAFILEGNDLPGYPRALPLIPCDRACAARLDCWGWTFSKASTQCWLKTWRARGPLYQSAGFVSGARPQ